MRELLGQIVGFAAAALIMLSFQCKTEKRLYIFQFVGGLTFVLHYILLFEYSGAVMNTLSWVRCLLLLTDSKYTRSKYTMLALVAIAVGLGIWSYVGILSLFPVIAQVVSTVFLYTKDQKKIKISQFCCTSPCWMIYNIGVFSVSGIICEAFNMISVVVYFLRERHKRAVGGKNVL